VHMTRKRILNMPARLAVPSEAFGPMVTSPDCEFNTWGLWVTLLCFPSPALCWRCFSGRSEVLA